MKVDTFYLFLILLLVVFALIGFLIGLIIQDIFFNIHTRKKEDKNATNGKAVNDRNQRT
jgi:hypothetical protein